MTLALLCSGQGLQHRGMFDLLVSDPAAAPVLASASAVLGRKVGALAAASDDGDLQANRTGQILCVARALAAGAALAPASPWLVAGYSVGEMAAWGLAGFWSADETLRLTARRAELMDAASSGGDRLGFVRGLDRDIVAGLVARFACAIAIVNPERLFIIGGDAAAVAECCEEALRRGAVAAKPIAVRVASHTPRLAPAVAPLLASLEAAETALPTPGRTLIAAATASVVTGRIGLAGLASQVAATIDWAATLEALVERGVDRMFELGPGTALAEMARAAFPNLAVRALDDFATLKGARAWVERYKREP